MAKHSYDDIIITVGALVLGLGLLKFFEGFSEAYAGFELPRAFGQHPYLPEDLQFMLPGTPIDCDEKQRHYQLEMNKARTAAEKLKWLQAMKRDKLWCNNKAREINQHEIEMADPGQFNLRRSLRPIPNVENQTNPIYPSTSKWYDNIHKEWSTDAAFARAYAVDGPMIINCDKPYTPTQDDLDFAKTLPPKTRDNYLRGVAANHKVFCAAERRRRVGDETYMEHGPGAIWPTDPSHGKLVIRPDNMTTGIIQDDTFSEYARAYAVAPCAAACTPFKGSPGTYATCCKQHAATAAAAKPKVVPARPAGFRTATLTPFQKANPLPVTKSKAPKPLTTGQLHQGQVKFVDFKLPDFGDLGTTKTKNPVQQPTDPVNGTDSSAPPSSAPSGTGGLPTPKRELSGFSKADKTERNYAGGGSSPTTQYDAHVGPVPNLMAVVYYTHPANCGGGHGDEADIKLWGPNHSEGQCCWCLVSVSGNGDVCTGGEGPHTKGGTDKCRQKVGNVGDVKGKNIGLAHVIRQTSGGAHSEVWVDLGTGFKHVGDYDGKCGKKRWSTGPNQDQQPQFRCDCADVQVQSAKVYEI